MGWNFRSSARIFNETVAGGFSLNLAGGIFHRMYLMEGIMAGTKKGTGKGKGKGKGKGMK